MRKFKKGQHYFKLSFYLIKVKRVTKFKISLKNGIPQDQDTFRI